MALRLLVLLLALPLAVIGQKDREAAQWGREGVAALDRGDHREAVKLLTKAWNAQPAEFDYPFELGRAYLLSGKAGKAEKVLHPLQYHQSARPELYMLLATAYDSLGRPKAKEETYRYGIQRFPQEGGLYNGLAAHYVNRDSVAAALAVCEMGLEKAPTYADNYFLAARIMEAKGDDLWTWWYGEVFLNLTDDASVKRDMAARVAASALRVLNGRWRPDHTPLDQAVKEAIAQCADDAQAGSIARQTALRQCFISHYQGKDAYAALLRRLKEQDVLELYCAHHFGENDREAFHAWLAGRAEDHGRFRDWFYWNGLTLDAPFTRNTIIAP